MIHTGLVSVTFRHLQPAEIIDLVSRAQLRGIEWGGDIHVPHGELRRAAEVSAMMRDAGLRACSYGSYYRLGTETDGDLFARIVDTARSLHAPIVRVWAGERGSHDLDPAERRRIVDDARRITELAADADLGVALEFHEETLADTAESVLRLFREIDPAPLRSYWQPLEDTSQAQCLDQLMVLRPRLAHLHIYHLDGQDRRPLAEGAAAWRRYLALAQSFAGDRYGLLEFVRDDAPEQFLEDAAVLRRLCAEAAQASPPRVDPLSSE